MGIIKVGMLFYKQVALDIGNSLGLVSEERLDEAANKLVLEFKHLFGVAILVIGRPLSGKSMMIRSLHGDYCKKSERQTNGEEPIKAWELIINGKKIKFSMTSDYAGSRSYHECNGAQRSEFEKILPLYDRVFFICNIEEYYNNKVDQTIGICVQEDICQRIGQIATLKAEHTTLEVIFSYVDRLSDKKKEEAERMFKTQLNAPIFADIKYHEVNFMDENSTKQLINNLFK